MVAAGGHHQQHVTPLQLNGVPARLPRLPQGRPCLHRTLSVRWGWNFLKRGPPNPHPKVLLLCQRRGSSGSLA